MSDSDSRCYVGLHEVFVALETKRLCKFVSLVMVWPGEQYKSGAFQAQSSPAYSSSTDLFVYSWIPQRPRPKSRGSPFMAYWEYICKIIIID